MEKHFGSTLAVAALVAGLGSCNLNPQGEDPGLFGAGDSFPGAQPTGMSGGAQGDPANDVDDPLQESPGAGGSPAAPYEPAAGGQAMGGAGPPEMVAPDAGIPTADAGTSAAGAAVPDAGHSDSGADEALLLEPDGGAP